MGACAFLYVFFFYLFQNPKWSCLLSNGLSAIFCHSDEYIYLMAVQICINCVDFVWIKHTHLNVYLITFNFNGHTHAKCTHTDVLNTKCKPHLQQHTTKWCFEYCECDWWRHIPHISMYCVQWISKSPTLAIILTFAHSTSSLQASAHSIGRVVFFIWKCIIIVLLQLKILFHSHFILQKKEKKDSVLEIM